jgi:hypothetical protein
MILILGIIGILIAIIAVALGQFVGTFVKKDGCPPSARMLIRKNGYQKATTRDLWMSGVTGSEIAEAIVLEDAMMQRIGSTIGLIIGTLGAVIAAGIILYAVLGNPSAGAGLRLHGGGSCPSRVGELAEIHVPRPA